MPIDNPPWSDKLIEANRAEIESSGLPVPTTVELGTGNYGAVYETDDPGVVFKVTSDPTEAKFIRAATPLGFPDGIVEYKAIIDFEGTFRRRGTYGIWREAAISVGIPYLNWGKSSDYEDRSLKAFSDFLRHFKQNAAFARDTLKRAKDPAKTYAEAKRFEQWAYENVGIEETVTREVAGVYGTHNYYASKFKGAQRVAVGLQACVVIAQNMEHTYLSDLVGGALTFYLENGILLADVHGDNVGRVDREDYDEGQGPWVITDPGHAVFLNDL
jgi:hypothetical protein